MTRSRAYLPLSQNFGEHSVGFSRTTYAHFPVVKNLISYWPLIEGAGAAVKDYWGPNNGTLNQTDNWSTGRWGNAYDFDGVDDYVSFGAGTSLSFGGDITILMWIKTDHIVGNHYLISDWSAAQRNYFVTTSGANLRLISGNGGGAQAAAVTSTAALSTNTWYYVGYMRSGNTLYAYLNGFEDGSGDITGFTGGATANNIVLGASNVGGSPFDGIIDEACVWNRALKRSEIVSMMWRRREG